MAGLSKYQFRLMKPITKDKLSSLFCWSIIHEEKMFHETDTLPGRVLVLSS